MIEADKDYLDKEFPKGKTKFRGQAMVLLALARREGQKVERERILEIASLLVKWNSRKIDDTKLILSIKRVVKKEFKDTWFKFLIKQKEVKNFNKMPNVSERDKKIISNLLLLKKEVLKE